MRARSSTTEHGRRGFAGNGHRQHWMGATVRRPLGDRLRRVSCHARRCVRVSERTCDRSWRRSASTNSAIDRAKSTRVRRVRHGGPTAERCSGGAPTCGARWRKFRKFRKFPKAEGGAPAGPSVAALVGDTCASPGRYGTLKPSHIPPPRMPRPQHNWRATPRRAALAHIVLDERAVRRRRLPARLHRAQPRRIELPCVGVRAGLPRTAVVGESLRTKWNVCGS